MPDRLPRGIQIIPAGTLIHDPRSTSSAHACAAVLFWRENDPQHFKHMSSAIMSIWQVETFDAWE